MYVMSKVWRGDRPDYVIYVWMLYVHFLKIQPCLVEGGEVTLTVGSEIFVPFSAYKKLITDFWDRGKSPPLSAKLYKLDVNRVNLVEFYMFAT